MYICIYIFSFINGITYFAHTPYFNLNSQMNLKLHIIHNSASMFRYLNRKYTVYEKSRCIISCIHVLLFFCLCNFSSCVFVIECLKIFSEIFTFYAAYIQNNF